MAQFLRLLFFVLMLTGWVSAQGLVICPSCGREGKPGERVCRACNAKLPVPRGSRAVRPSTPSLREGEKTAPSASVVPLADEAVRDAVAQMRRFESRQPALAYWYAAHALAFLRLLPEDHFPPRARQIILEGNKRILGQVRLGWVRCPLCSGSGKVKMRMDKRDGTTVEGPARPCKMCGGRGGRIGTAPVDKVKLALQQGRREFDRQRIAAGDLQLGALFIPKDLLPLLGNRQRALVMTGMPVPCSACLLVGRQTCSACKGTGWERCDSPTCDNGMVKVKKTRGHQHHAIRLNDSFSKVCQRCGGTGKIYCAVCRGDGTIACKKCQGSGVAPDCRKCAGAGCLPCTRCKGTGKVWGEVCASCRGEGIILCPTCHGAGAVAR